MFSRFLPLISNEVLLVASMLAQGVPNAPLRASEQDISQWLQGGDIRMVAWAAYFAAQNHDTAAVHQLALRAESWQPLPEQEFDDHGNYIPRSQEQRERSEAMTQVLDALIQLEGTVSPQAVKQLAKDFPAQALTFFARLPEPERTELAEDIYNTRRGAGAVYDWRSLNHDQMVHMAAAILAQHPPDGFTASLLNETSVVLNVIVTDAPQRAPDRSGTSVCGDSFAAKPITGWPQPWTYVVEERWHQENPDERSILVKGDPAITTRRALSNSSCSTLRWFSSAVRLRVVEQEAGASPGQLDEGIEQYDNLAYTGPNSYFAALVAIIRRHNQEFRDLSARLQRLDKMTPREAEMAGPVFHLRITDERANRTEPLPEFHPDDPKIVFDIADVVSTLGPWLDPF